MRMIKRYGDNVYILFFLYSLENVINCCQIQGRDFKILADNSPWQSWNGSSGSLEISLCQALSSSNCGENVSICYYDAATKNYMNFGNLGSGMLNESENLKHFTIQLEGGNCSIKDNQLTLTTIIYFKCGKSLGYPVVLPSSNPCRLILVWETTVGCSKGSKLSEVEVTKCYFYNSQHLLINLNILDDEYEVEVANDDDDDDDDNDDDIANIKGGLFKVSVCRNMDSGESCPGLGACLILNGIKTSLGRISKGLMADGKGDLTIVYGDHRSSDRVSNYPIAFGCNNINTTIKFSCPERGMGSPPRLVSGFSGCTFDIIWETEVACPVANTTVNSNSSSCLMASQRQGINIDLTGLSSDEPRTVNVTDEGGNLVKYELHVCSNGTIRCGKHDSSACQTNLGNGNVMSIGNFSLRTFRYIDGALQMVLDGGEPCGTGFYRNTIIDFHCDRNASNAGHLSFAYEDMCTYVFDWSTPLACLVPSVPCTFKRGGLAFDLSNLIRMDGEENWKTADDSTVLNVCRGLLVGNSQGANCTSSAICRKDGTEYRNHGGRVLRPTHDDARGAVKLDYVEGEECLAGKRRSATVYLFCDPNVLNSQPYIVGSSDEGCHLELEWHSSAACGRGHIIGRDCSVGDPMTGLRFDLSPLRLTGHGKWYNILTPEYDYLINVCAALVDSPCSQSEVGVCQVSRKNDRQVHSTGRWNDQPHYSNGALRLTYGAGDDYRSVPPVPRHTDIDFVCNRGVGLGEPLFVAETNRTYKFVWHTELACPTGSEKCSSFVAGGQSYDLSFLVQQGNTKNWEMMVSDNGKSYRLVFNLCQGLRVGPEIKTCDPLHSACLISLDDDEIIVLGRSLKPPSAKEGRVALNYENGGKCNDTTYSLEIDLLCYPTDDKSLPMLVEKIPPCKFKVTWSTRFACPDDSHRHGSDNRNTSHDFNDSNCTIRLDSSGQTFDISKYEGRTFEVTKDSDVYKITICGKSPACGEETTACRTVGGLVEESASVNGRRLSLGPDGMPQLQLSSDKLKLLVKFECDPASSDGRVSFDSRRSDWLIFTFATPAACPSKVVPCLAYDEGGNRYDLQPLSKKEGSWTAVNLFGDVCDFNLCRSLATSSIDSCNSAGACIVKNGTSAKENAGYITGSLLATGKGSLQLRYSGGTPCKTGKRSTLILLQCSPIQHVPILMSTFDECESLIQWSTPFACSDKEVLGKQCRVSHPTYPSQVFDLTPLRDSGDHEVDFDVGKYLIGVCSAVLKEEKCKEMEAGGCLVTGGIPRSMGTYNDLLLYSDGKLSLNYSADSGPFSSDCPDGRVSTRIDFVCEHDNSGISSGPVYLSGSCHRKFEWVTSLACFKYRKAKCSIKDEGGFVYDLSHLILHDSNYEVTIDGGKTKFLINVCSTLVHVEGNICPPDSSACKIDTTAKMSTSIGSISDKTGEEDSILSLFGDKVVMTYKTREATTMIYFLCDGQSPETSRPSYLGNEGSNVFLFTWKTRLVCQQKDQVGSGDDCSVLDPDTNRRYDLSSLQAKGPQSVQAHGREFNVSVCPPEKLLTYEHGTILQRYPYGQVCDKDNQTSSTFVIFLCPWDGDKEGVEFVMRNEACLHVFRWKTKLLCRRELSCVVHGDGRSLSSLVKHEGGYKVNTSRFAGDVEGAVINVCSNLSQAGECKGDHAVCIKTSYGTYVSGGVAAKEPEYDKTSGEISITYENGDPCLTGIWSSRIVFTCSKIHETNPSLIAINEGLCFYKFEWRTYLACTGSNSGPDSSSTFDGCELKVGEDAYDLSGVERDLASKEMASKNVGSRLKVRLCSKFELGPCSSSAACLFDSSGSQVKGYGSKAVVKPLREGKDLKLLFESDKNEPKSAVIILICDPSKALPAIQVLHEGDLEIIFNIETNVTCQPTLPTSPIMPSPKAHPGRNFYALYIVLTVTIFCSCFVIVGIFIRRRRRNHRGYEPVDASHYRDYDDEIQSPLFQEEERSQPILQNYASDDDLML